MTGWKRWKEKLRNSGKKIKQFKFSSNSIED
jgi:hypothetical protein